jgi:NADPH:quinone reductase-like Zn-dependent oxidoreductase
MIRNILRKRDGAFANVIAVKGDVQMKIPDNISDIDAATQGIALITMVGRDMKYKKKC